MQITNKDSQNKIVFSISSHFPQKRVKKFGPKPGPNFRVHILIKFC